jgi:hypothetical protein
MVPTDTDRAHRQRFEPRPDDGHLYLLRDSTPNHDRHDPGEPRRQYDVGSVQAIRTLREAATDPSDKITTSVFYDGLSAARGMIFGVALGIVFWLVIAGLIRYFVF